MSPAAQHPSATVPTASSTTRTTSRRPGRPGAWGGRRRKREGTLQVAYDFDGLTTVPAIRRLLEVAVALAATRLLEVGELEQRVEGLEQAVSGWRPSAWSTSYSG